MGSGGHHRVGVDNLRGRAAAFAGGGRAIIRPSGTEPKIKLYVEIREPLAPGEPWEAAEERCLPEVATIGRELAAAAGLA